MSGITITFDVNVNVPGLLPFLNSWKESIMETLETLQAKATALGAKVDELKAEVEVANGKTDGLIVTATTTKDALVALQAQLAGGQVVTSAQLDAVAATLDAGLASATAAKDSLVVQEGETDAAATAVAP